MLHNGIFAGRQIAGEATRRSFMGGLAATAGLAGLGDTAHASSGTIPRQAGSVYYVIRTSGTGTNNGKQGNGQQRQGRGGSTYQVIDGETGGVAFGTDETADVAFQYAFDQVAGDGGTVVASSDTFQFGAPATLGDGTVLTGHGGTRFVASQTGTVETILPDDEQGPTVPTGHDLIRIRGDGTAVTGIDFDANGTQRANHAIQADSAEGVVIANNRTVNGFQMAISFTRCRDVTVTGNEVVDPNWYGITSRAAPAGSTLDLRRSSDVLIANNRVSGMKFNNIAPYNVSNFTVFGNVVFDGGHSLIACSPSQQGAIVGNVCRGLDIFAPDPGGEAGIEIEYKRTHLRTDVAGTPRARSFDITITGNQVDNCPVGVLARTVAGPEQNPDTARAELRPYGFTITGNTVSSAADAGIRIRSGEDGVVATNTVRDSATAIDSDGEFTAAIQHGLNVTR